MKIRAAIFDMDGTLIRNTDSVEYLCMLNNNSKEHDRIRARESGGEVTWIEADRLKAKLIRGLELEAVENNFAKSVHLIRNIDKVLSFLREAQIASVLMTSGPIQVAEILGRVYGFDSIFGSDYEIENREFTGKIKTHLGNDGKLRCLTNYCTTAGFSPKHCVAVGDSESDISLFEECGRSIAINYTAALEGKASEYILTDDLLDISRILNSWLGE